MKLELKAGVWGVTVWGRRGEPARPGAAGRLFCTLALRELSPQPVSFTSQGGRFNQDHGWGRGDPRKENWGVTTPHNLQPARDLEIRRLGERRRAGGGFGQLHLARGDSGGGEGAPTFSPLFSPGMGGRSLSLGPAPRPEPGTERAGVAPKPSTPGQRDAPGRTSVLPEGVLSPEFLGC